MRVLTTSTIAVALLGLGCGRTPPADAPAKAVAAARPVTDRDWRLVSLGENTNPKGSGGQPITLRLDAATTRAAGFAGCNRYSAGYLLTADSLKFTAPISTKMACADGMDAESSFLAALVTVVSYQATDSTLTLSGPAGPLARFRAP
jgi:heat shock protein HslJ